MNTKEIRPVYLRSGDRGLYTYINRKIYFIDREYATPLNKEGIAFVFVTKEKDKYGFLGGSYEANNWDNGDYKEYLTPKWVERLEDVYIYNGCIFYFIRDNLSDGISVYYYNSDIKGLMCITGRSISGRGAYSDNMNIRDYIIQNSKRISEDIYIDIADTLFKDEKSKTSLFQILLSHFYTCPLSVSISEGKVLRVVEKGYFGDNFISYGVILNGRYCGITNYFTSNLAQKLNFTKDVSEEFKNWCNSNYITKKNMNTYSEDGLRVVTSEFLGAKKSVVLVDKYSENVESVYSKHKEEIERSVKEYKEWVSGLKKYVTVKNAKQYREIQLDRLLWTGDL